MAVDPMRWSPGAAGGIGRWRWLDARRDRYPADELATLDRQLDTADAHEGDRARLRRERALAGRAEATCTA